MAKTVTNNDQPTWERPPVEAMKEHAADAARLMNALGNESRLMILCMLAEGEQSVSDLNEIIPLSQSALSQHLAKLRREGLVVTRREAQTIFYALPEGPADKIIHLLHDIYCGDMTICDKDNK